MFIKQRHIQVGLSLVGMGLFGASLAQAQSPQTTIDEVVMYGINHSNSELFRYEFGVGTRDVIGTVRLTDGTPLTDIESLAYIPGQMHFYAVWNTANNTRSQLVKIDMFTAEATPLSSETGYGNVEGLTIVNELERGPGDSPTSVILKDSNGVDAYEVSFLDVIYNDDDTSSWTYHVRELGTGQDLSHWDLALDESHQVMDGTTAGYHIGTDGSTGFYGIKWNVNDAWSEGDFTIVLDQHYAGTYDGTGVGVLAKGGGGADVNEIFGPLATVPPEHTIYGVHSDGMGQKALLSIDAATGIAQAEMQVSRPFEGLAAGNGGRLYAIHNDQLWRLKPFADQEILIGASIYQNSEALEYAVGDSSRTIEIPGVDPAFWQEGIMFAFSDTENSLLLIDSASGNAMTYASGVNLMDVECFIFVTLDSDLTESLVASVMD